MIHTNRNWLFAIFSFSLLVFAGVGVADESLEPKQKYELKIGDKTISVVEGEPLEINGEFKDPTIKIVAGKFRSFPYGGVSFLYPSNYVFEADLSDPDAKSWTLTGNSYVVMVFELNAEMTTEQFANEMVGQFGSENAKVANTNLKIKLGDHDLMGTQLDVSVASQKLVLQILKVPSENGETKLLVFQDSTNSSGDRSSEAKSTLATLQRTFKTDSNSK